MKDGKIFELPVIDLTGDDPQPSQLRTPELIDLTEDSSIQTIVSASRNSSSMQTSSMYKHQINAGYVSVFNDGPIVLDDEGNIIEDNYITNNIAANSNVSRNVEGNHRTSNNASARSKTSKSQTKSPEKLNNDYLFAALKTPKEAQVMKAILKNLFKPCNINTSIVKTLLYLWRIPDLLKLSPTLQRRMYSLFSREKKHILSIIPQPHKAEGMAFEQRGESISYKQNLSSRDSANSMSSALMFQTSNSTSLEASRVARANSLEYQRTRVHNTRKNSPPPNEREQVALGQIHAAAAEEIPVIDRAPSLLVCIKDEKPEKASRTMSHCREHIGGHLTKVNAKNSRKKPAEAVEQPAEKTFKSAAPRNALSSSSQIETMLLNKERLVVMPEFLYQGVLEMCRSDTARLLKLIQDALERNDLTLYLFLINAQAINNADHGGQSDISSGELKPLGQWRSLLTCLEKCSLVADNSNSSSSSNNNSSSSSSRANNKLINQCTQILRIWNDFLIGEFLPDESDWDIGAFLSIWMKAFLSFDDTGTIFEGGISFLESFATFLGNSFRRRHLMFANHMSSGPVISDTVNRVDMATIYRAILYILDPSAQNDKKEEDCAQPPLKGKPGRKPRSGSSKCSQEEYHGSSNSSAHGPGTNFMYQHLFGDTKVFEWDPAVALKMLKVATNDLVPDKEFALFLLKVIVDVLTGFDDSVNPSENHEDSKWTDLCAFINNDRVSDLCKFVLTGGLVSGSSVPQKRTADGGEKSPLAELKFLVR